MPEKNNFMDKPLFLWDIDDVLNDLVQLCINTTAQCLAPGISFDQIYNNPPLEELNCTPADYMKILDECREQYLFQQPPKREVLDFFESCGNRFHALTLSSAPMDLAPRASEWVLRHFGRWIQGTIFVPSPRKHIPAGSVLFASKAEAVNKLNGILIDDMPINVEAVRHAGGRAIYFPAPWNENRDIPVKDFLEQLRDRFLD